MISPLYVHYYDNQSATIYNLTEEQYKKIMFDDDENGNALVDKFIVDFRDFSDGYIPAEVIKLAEIYGFEVGTE